MNTTQFDEGALLQAGTTAPVRDPVLASLLPRLTPSVVAAATLSLAIAYFLGLAIYRLNFHPCAKYPGPFWCKISPLPWLYHYFRNENVAWVDRLHSEYGPTVRLAPSHLSYIQPTAWKDIYGHKTATRKSNPKDTFAPSIKGAHPLVTIPDDAHHAKRRKIFNNAFSDRALMQQEGLIGKYVDGLVALIKGKIAESPDGKAKVDAIVLTNCVAFDIIGDLTFGEGLGLVETGKLSPWVEAMADNLKFLFALAVLSQIPFAGFVAYMLAPKSMMEKVILHAKSSDERVEKRMQKGPDARPDIWGLVLQQDEEMSREEMNVNASMFMTAGTETTATSMSGILWLLAKNPDKLNKVLAEVRSVPDESHLTADKVRHMKYLCAVIEEGLRLYPAIAFGNFRRTPSGGTTIQGDYLPEKIRINVAPYTSFRSPLYWKDATKYVPERWITDDSEYAEYHNFDDRRGMLPFGTGARACIGKNLAYYEMRIILAKFFFNFDYELCPESDNWINHGGWLLWDKPPLPIKIWERS